nr:hypothetical protein [Clostridium paraputrificum]
MFHHNNKLVFNKLIAEIEGDFLLFFITISSNVPSLFIYKSIE